MRAAVYALLAAATIGGAHAAQPIGRLFFTPAERAQLDVARAQKHVPAPAAAQQAEAPSAPQVITYSGIVRRNDGKATLWLNNKPVDAGEGLSGLSVKGRVKPDGAVTLRVPETGTSIELKVGQRAELQTGRVAESRREEPKPDATKPDAPKEEAAAKSDAPAKDAAKAPVAPAKSDSEPGERKAESPAPTPSRDGASHADLAQRAAREKK